MNLPGDQSHCVASAAGDSRPDPALPAIWDPDLARGQTGVEKASQQNYSCLP